MFMMCIWLVLLVPRECKIKENVSVLSTADKMGSLLKLDENTPIDDNKALTSLLSRAGGDIVGKKRSTHMMLDVHF